MEKIKTFLLKLALPAAWSLLLAVLTAADPALGAGDNALAQGTSEMPAESRDATLLKKHAALAGQLASNPYGRPLFLQSSETTNMVSGDAYAVLESPFATFSATFKSPNHWCDVLILHINTKYCRAGADTSPSTLKMRIGKKTAQELHDAFALEFAYQLVAASPSYIAAHLNAPEGPLGTSNYRIELQAVPLGEGKTFMHLRYSYGYGVAGRLAMQGYLATVGSRKIGFTQINEGQKSRYVGGMRGTVERNTMRYYLAIEAFLASLGQPTAQQLDKRLQYWFDATEEYSQQLHEVDRDYYVSMKKTEYQRQKSSSPN